MSDQLDDDATTHLTYDPAAVVIRASRDKTMLDRLGNFAKQLAKYVDLAKQQQQQTHQTNHAIHSSNVENTRHTRRDTRRDDEIQDSKTENTSKEENQEDCEPRAKKKRTRHRLQENSDNSASVAIKQEDEKGISKTTSENRSSRKRSRAPPLPSSQSENRRPRTLRNGYNGRLRESKLRRSAGKTRKVLNKHLDKLGLTASFANGVVSKHGNHVSHITLSDKWNHLPYDSHETLEWWLGEGLHRLGLASPLNPQKFQQSPIPIFWAGANHFQSTIVSRTGGPWSTMSVTFCVADSIHVPSR